MIERDDFGTHGPIHDVADFLGYFHEIAARLCDQRRIGGDAIEQAGVGHFPDVGDVGSVDEEFHGFALRKAFEVVSCCKGIARSESRLAARLAHGSDASSRSIRKCRTPCRCA